MRFFYLYHVVMVPDGHYLGFCVQGSKILGLPHKSEQLISEFWIEKEGFRQVFDSLRTKSTKER